MLFPRVLGGFSLRVVLFSSLLLISLAWGGIFVQAATSTDLQSKINGTQSQINQLQADIIKLQAQLNATSKQKQTLQNALDTLTLSKRKLQTQITLTQTQINQVNLQIQTLSTSISTTSDHVNADRESIGGTLRDLNETDESPFVLVLLSGNTLGSIFDEISALSATRSDLQDQIGNLTDLKTTLQTSKTVAQKKYDRLATLKNNLGLQKSALSATIASQNQLLAQTKDRESNYQKLITQKRAQESEFENELNQYQSQLTNKVNTSSLPHPGSGVLSWPLASTYDGACPAPAGYISCITQYFGNTPFATANPQIYNGAGHDGIDLRASPGTPILSAGDGVILGIGNTDLTCLNASYGKWVFIKHTNGLSTLYGHLSVISVSAGQQVTSGQVIGYSGSTGYATGPHLHFTVMASDASEISSFASKGCPGKIYTMPVGPLDSYLNPLSYL